VGLLYLFRGGGFKSWNAGQRESVH